MRKWRAVMAAVAAMACAAATVTDVDTTPALAAPVTAAPRAPTVPAQSDVAGGGGTVDPSTFQVWAIERWRGGIRNPPGASECAPWFPVSGSRDLPTDVSAVAVIGGIEHILWGRLCNSVAQLVWVPDLDVTDVGGLARDSLIETLPPPSISLSPPAELQVVNFETWLAVRRPEDVTSRPLSLPNLTVRAFAAPRQFVWDPDQGDRLPREPGADDLRRCTDWAATTDELTARSTRRPQCRWTPPWIGTTTGRVTVGWDVRWEASNGTAGTLDGLSSTATYDVVVDEIVTVGQSIGS